MAKKISSAVVRPHFVATPLQIEMVLEPASDVPGIQSVDEINGGWWPDYTMTPFVVRPRIAIADPDHPANGEALTEGALAAVADETWKVLDESGQETVVNITDTGDYVIDGQTLKVKRNAASGRQLTISYSCLYRYGSNSYRLEASMPVRCIPVTVGTPKLTCNLPTNVAYYPVRDEAKIPLEFTLANSEGEWDAAKWAIQVEHSVPDGAGGMKWQVVGEHGSAGENLTDAEFMLVGKTLTVDRSVMDAECRFRVRAKYQLPDGTWRGVGMGATEVDCPTLNFLYRRVMPPGIESSIHGMPDELPEGMEKVTARVELTDNLGVIEDAGEWFSFSWYVSEGKKDGSVSWQKVGDGDECELDVSAMQKYGFSVQAEAEDKGAKKVLTYQGKVLTYDGKWLVS